MVWLQEKWAMHLCFNVAWASYSANHKPRWILFHIPFGGRIDWISKSIRSSRCKNYAILPHQKPTLLFYHIILQYPICQMFYIFTISFIYYFLILFNSYFILSLYLFLTVIFVPIIVIFSNLINSNDNIFKQSS